MNERENIPFIVLYFYTRRNGCLWYSTFSILINVFMETGNPRLLLISYAVMEITGLFLKGIDVL